MSLMSGSSGLASVSSEQIDRRTLTIRNGCSETIQIVKSLQSFQQLPETNKGETCQISHKQGQITSAHEVSKDGSASNLRNGEGWAPLAFEDIQTDCSGRVDIWMVNLCGKCDSGRLEWIVCGELDS